jgi:hypothetical protein
MRTLPQAVLEGAAERAGAGVRTAGSRYVKTVANPAAMMAAQQEQVGRGGGGGMKIYACSLAAWRHDIDPNHAGNAMLPTF